MAYIATQEDWEKIEEDKKVIAAVHEEVVVAVKRLMDEHIAVPALSAVLEATLEDMEEAFPPMMVFDHLMGGQLHQCIREYMIVVYTLGVAMGTISHNLHEMPCAQSGEDHLHDLEDILNNAPQED